ncbi:MAG TPA: DNA polymerase I [Solirubrobacterales bacterium]|nr:DNA polymerase I [Solirubrobacterales bacterium]
MPATTQKKAPAKGSKPSEKGSKGATRGKEKPGELFLIDGNSLAYRAFFALPESIATHDGRPTNAIYGLASMFAKMLIDHDPSAVVVCWDAGWSGRELTYEPYKSERKPRPDLLRDQWPHLMPLAEAFGFSNIKVDGYEADDVIASLTKRAHEQDIPVMVVSGDRDVYQLVEDGVRVMTTSRGVTDTKIYDRDGVVERYGVPPELVTDLIGLKGDTSDNIPGVPGIGDKTAAQLLQEYGDLEGVLSNIDKISGAKRKENLTDHAEDARISKQLATAITDIDVELDLDELMSKRMDRSRLREVAREFELRVILQRLEEELGSDFVPDSKVEEELDAEADRGSVDDLAEGEVALAIVAKTWSGYDGKRLLEGDCPELAALAMALGSRRLIGHDLKSLGGGAQHGLIAAAGVGTLDLRHDTMVGAYLLDPARRSYDLIDIAAQRGLAAAPKESAEGDGQLELGDEPPPDPAAEARLVWEIAQMQRKDMKSQGIERLMDEVEMPLIEVLADMEQTGVKLDEKRLADINEGFEQRIETLQADIFELAGHEFTIGSPQQLAEVFFDELGLTKKRRGKTGFSTDARVLSQIRGEHPIVEKVEQWRELTKLKSTYLDALPELIDPNTGRLHTTFNQTATATGRLSSTNPNLQNIPIRTEEGRPIRSCFVAPRGDRLLSADYNQIELRILAHIAGEEALREIFARGEDIHAATAAEVLGSDPKKVTPGERSKAKMVNYGIAYGLSAYGLADRLNIEQDEAAQYIDRYFERFPAVKRYIEETIEFAREKGYVETLLGRRRPIPELRSGRPQVRSQGERLAVNMPIQGTSADIIKIAMVHAHRALAESVLETRLVLQIHDELLFEGPAAEMEAASELVEREMTQAFELDPPLAVDVGVGSDWLAAK